jgi:hypothetical protein
MVLIQSNSAMSGVQDWIFILMVLFGLVMTQLSHADDGTVESVLAVEAWCRYRVMLVMTLLSHAGDAAAESMLATTRQGAATDRQVVVAARQGDAVDHQGAATDRQGVIVGHQGVATDYPSAAK